MSKWSWWARLDWVQVVVYSVTGVALLKVAQSLLGYVQYRSQLAYDRRPMVYEHGVLYLHIFPRDITRQMPNLSPFVVKMETWLRMHNIKYQVGNDHNICKE